MDRLPRRSVGADGAGREEAEVLAKAPGEGAEVLAKAPREDAKDAKKKVAGVVGAGYERAR